MIRLQLIVLVLLVSLVLNLPRQGHAQSIEDDLLFIKEARSAIACDLYSLFSDGRVGNEFTPPDSEYLVDLIKVAVGQTNGLDVVGRLYRAEHPYFEIAQDFAVGGPREFAAGRVFEKVRTEILDKFDTLRHGKDIVEFARGLYEAGNCKRFTK